MLRKRNGRSSGACSCGRTAASHSCGGRPPRPPSARTRSCPRAAALEVVVDQPARLHERVGGRRPDEAEAAPLELLRERRATPPCSPARRPARAARGARGGGRERPDEAAGRSSSARRPRARWRWPPRSSRGCGRCPRRPSAAPRRPARRRPRRRSRSRRRRPGTPGACAGWSATTARTGRPRASAARTARRRPAPAGPTPRRGRRRTPAPTSPTRTAGGRPPLA